MPSAIGVLIDFLYLELQPFWRRPVLTNEDIWKPTTWNSKRERSIRVCGRKRFFWHTIYTVVERVEIQGSTLIVVVAAAGQDYRNPTEHDLANSAAAAFVVAKQRKFKPYRGDLRIYLEYPGSIVLGIDVDIDETEDRIRSSMLKEKSRGQLQLPIPSMFFNLLQKMRRS